jgi:hypothetical protein
MAGVARMKPFSKSHSLTVVVGGWDWEVMTESVTCLPERAVMDAALHWAYSVEKVTG